MQRNSYRLHCYSEIETSSNDRFTVWLRLNALCALLQGPSTSMTPVYYISTSFKIDVYNILLQLLGLHIIVMSHQPNSVC